MYLLIVALFLVSIILLICGFTAVVRSEERRENCWPGLSCNDCPNPCSSTKKKEE